jgi:RimJ/RimL family protein N-acetyltransferase
MIEGEKVRLRSVELSDLDEIMKHWNKMELRKLVGNLALGPASRNDEEEWIKNTWKQRRERRAFIFAIETTSEDKLIGTLGLHGCDWTNRSAVLGIAIYDPKNRGRGYGQEAINLLLDFAFKTLNLNRVELETYDFNQRAQKCFKKVGFREVGRKRKAHFVNGKYHDIIVMDILREDWLSLAKSK